GVVVVVVFLAEGGVLFLELGDVVVFRLLLFFMGVVGVLLPLVGAVAGALFGVHRGVHFVDFLLKLGELDGKLFFQLVPLFHRRPQVLAHFHDHAVVRGLDNTHGLAVVLDMQQHVAGDRIGVRAVPHIFVLGAGQVHQFLDVIVVPAGELRLLVSLFLGIRQ